MAKITDGREMATLFFEDYDGKELGRKVEDYVNCFTFDKEGFIDYLKESDKKDEFLDILFLWIVKLRVLKLMDYYDLRNEYSVETGVEIYKAFPNEVENVEIKYDYEGQFLDDYDYRRSETTPKEIMFIETMARSHRTLQQCFTGIVFKALTLYPQFEERVKKLEYNFYGVPLI